MPTKRKPGRWQDYTRAYQVARRKQNTARTRFCYQRASEISQHADALTVLAIEGGGLLKLSRMKTKRFLADVQSEVTTDFADVLIAHHGSTLAFSAKESSTTLFASDRQLSARRAELESIQKWHGGSLWPLSVESDLSELVAVTHCIWTAQIGTSAWKQTQIPIGEHWRLLFPSEPLLMFDDTDIPRSVSDWVTSPDAILQRLRDMSHGTDEQRLAVLFAETMDFDEAERAELLPFLHRYILKHRFTKDEDTQTSVGAAARKYSMNMDETEFEAYAELLTPSQTQTLNHWTELELVKGVCWRITYEAVQRQYFPTLTRSLYEIASDYVKPRLILQKNYASTALYAIVAVVILQALSAKRYQAEAILEQVSDMGVEWFSELVEDRLVEASEAIEEHDPQLADSVRDIVGAQT